MSGVYSPAKDHRHLMVGLASYLSSYSKMLPTRAKV